MTSRASALTLATLAAATLFATKHAEAQPVSGLYIAAGAGGNFMRNESFSASSLGGATTSTQKFLFGPPVTTTTPPYNYTAHGSLGFDPGGVVVLSAGYGFGNGVRVELEADYRINSYSIASAIPSAYEQKFGGMLNVFYDLPLRVFGITPYAGLGAGYMWVDRDHLYDRTDGFAYQAILGGALPIPGIPGLSATLEYRFMGLAGADHGYTVPGYSFSNSLASGTQGPTVGKNKYNDDFNNSVMIGLRYAFNTAPAPVALATPAPAPPAATQRTYLVFFDWDRADLTDRARQIIAEAARATTQVHVTRIQVSGNTDTTGTASYNQGLSVRRAETVAAELVRNGVPRTAISTQGFGFSHLLVPTGAGVREPQNRRVEIVLQ